MLWSSLSTNWKKIIFWWSFKKGFKIPKVYLEIVNHKTTDNTIAIYQGTTIQMLFHKTLKWKGMNTGTQSSPAPRDNSFDFPEQTWNHCFIILYTSTTTTNPLKMIMSACHTIKKVGTTLFWKKYSIWQEWRTAHRSRAWNSSDPEVGEHSTVSLRQLF